MEVKSLEREQSSSHIENIPLAQMLAHSATAMIWVCDTKKYFTYFNDSWLLFRGTKMSEEIGLGWSEGVHPDDFDRCWSDFTAAFDQLAPFSMDYRLLHADGNYRWVRDDGSPHIDDQGVFQGYVGSCFDITEQVEAKKQVEEREHLFQILVETITDVFWISNCGITNITYVSPGVEKIWGIKIEQLYLNPKLFLEAIVEEDRPPLIEMLEQFHAQGKSYECNYRIIDKDKNIRHIHERGYPVKNELGEVLFMAGICHDVTKQQQLQDTLNQAHRMDAIGQLAGGLAHDYNNQLAGIMGYAELMLNRVEDETLADFSKKIISTCERAGQLTKKLLTFSSEAHEHFSVFDVHDVVKDTLDMITHSFDKLIVINSTLGAKRSNIKGHTSLIQNVILNLAINARDAMPDGGNLTISTSNISIEQEDELTISSELKVGEYILVSVQDSGVGISDDLKPRLFDMFFTTKSESEGTGLGLPSALWTVRQHGGTISFDCENDTVFYVYLPLVVDELQSKSGTQGANLANSSVYQVLVVDDEEALTEIAECHFKSQGHKVITANNGRQATDIYREKWQSIDFVVLDMMMPEQNGLETYKKMKEINPDILAILLSGFADEAQIKNIKQEGVKAVLHKPIKYNEVLRLFDELIG